MLWTALFLIMMIRMLGARQDGVSWAGVFTAMIPYPPLVALLAWPHRRRVRAVLTALLALLYAAPFAIMGDHWEWLPWPLAAAALCALPGRVGWPLFGLVLAATDLIGLWAGQSALAAFLWTYKTANDGLVIFGLYALVAMVTALHATRGELARMRLRRERLRLDRELHAVVGTRLRVLGHELSQALDGEAGAAHDRLAAAVVTARQALREIRSAAGGLREAHHPASAPIESPRAARLSLGGIVLCTGLIQVVTSQVNYHRPWRLLLLVPVLCAAAAVVLWMRRSRRQIAILALIVVPTAIPAGYFVWDLSLLVDFWPFLAGLVLTQVRRPLSWIAVGVLFTLYVSAFYYPPPVPNLAGQAGTIVSFTILTWTTYSLARLSTLVEVLRQARQDLARQAVADERTRVARDLHDTLSFSLSAVALKAELCQRMLRSAPDEAWAQMAELPELAERALVQLASLAESPVELRCEQELAAACSVLESAGVQPSTVLEGWPLPRDVDAAVALTLREAITNVVKHSSARTCSITIASAAGTVRLRVANDGVAEHAEHADIAGHARRSREPGQRGSGLVGMAERTGGRLTARPLPGGRFEVVAEFATGPVTDPAA